VTVGDRTIIVLTDVKRELDQAKTMTDHLVRLRSLQGTIVPSRLLDEGVDRMRAGFMVNCTFALAPPDPEETDASNWASAVGQFENKVIERCKEECDDVDLLRASSRDFMLLFGLGGLYPRELLVEMAIFIAIDLLRWAVESSPRNMMYQISVLITAGEGTEFEFNRETGNFSVSGPMFDRQALLREVNDCPNGLLICEETHTVWDELKLGGQWELLPDDKRYRIVLLDESER
jgi:hypothetical protein